MTTHAIISKLISNIKGEKWELDPSIPLMYLLNLLTTKFIMYVKGVYMFRKLTSFTLIGPKTKIKCKTKIHIEKNVFIDRNCYIDAMSENGIRIGNNVSIGKNTTIECSGSLKLLGKGLIIGANVGLGSHGFFGCAGGVCIGEDTILGNFVSIHSENHNFNDDATPIRLQGVKRTGITIGRNCWIGAKVTILDGTILEDGCVVAAGTVLTKGTYQKNSIIAGIPGKIIAIRPKTS